MRTLQDAREEPADAAARVEDDGALGELIAAVKAAHQELHPGIKTFCERVRWGCQRAVCARRCDANEKRDARGLEQADQEADDVDAVDVLDAVHGD